MNRIWTLCGFLSLLCVLAAEAWTREPQPSGAREQTYETVQTALLPMARLKAKPMPGDWLYAHKEDGQTFEQYVKSQPVRRNTQWKTIYVCIIGDLTKEQKEIVQTTCEYMELFFDTPVKMRESVPLSEISEYAQRKQQILSTYVLDKILKPSRPEDALASLAFTARDLWPGAGWNYVFGQASLRERTGVWSIHRFGDPAESPEAYQLCLERTLATAVHETMHILSMPHCKTHDCCLNGSNSLLESDEQPLSLCPECQRKLLWNLQVDPVKHFEKQEEFFQKHSMKEEANWYRKAIESLKREK